MVPGSRIWPVVLARTTDVPTPEIASVPNPEIITKIDMMARAVKAACEHMQQVFWQNP